MKEIINKISSYELFNHVIPGTVFLLYVNKVINLSIEKINSLYFIILAYVCGVIIGRIGSLMFKHVVYRIFKDNNKRNYKDYIDACKKDGKIELLISSKNMYRNFASMFFLLSIFTFGCVSLKCVNFKFIYLIIACLIILTILFTYSCIRVGNFIGDRIDIALHNKNKKNN